MEVMPQLMTTSEVVQKKQEVMHHHDFEDDLEEVVEEALLKRRSNTTITTTRTVSDGSTLTTVSSISSTGVSVSASSSSDDVSAELDNSKNIDEPILEEAGNEDKEEENSVYLDKNEDKWKCRHCTWTCQNGFPWVDHIHSKPFNFHSGGTGVEWSQFSVKVDDLAGKLNENGDIQQVLSAVRPLISGKPVENLTGPIRKEPETAATYELGESDEEVVELEFETAVHKMHTHNDYNMYCPNCSSQITKVVLRRKIRHRTAPKIERGDLFGCLSCFSIFVSSGKGLNPFGIFAGRDPNKNIEPLQQRPTSDVTVPTSGSTQAAGKGFHPLWFWRKGIDDGSDLTSPLLPAATVQASSTAVTSPTAEKQPSFPKVTSKTRDEVIQQGWGYGLFWPFKKGRDNDNASTSPPLGAEKVQSSSPATISKPRDQPIEEGAGPPQQIEDENVIIDVRDKPETLVDGMKEPRQPELLEVTEMMNTYSQPEEILADGTKEPRQPDLLEVTEMMNTYYQPEDPGVELRITVPSEPTSPVSVTEPGSSRSVEIVKSIVYGGLLESIASLSVVSSAAAADATTLNIVALGLANLVGGLVVLVHNLRDLRFGESNETNEARYKEELGKKEHFLLHATVAVLSYIIFGLIPPVTYGFAFRETNDRDFKMLAVAAAAFLCIIILAIAKVYGRGEHQFKTYFKTVLYYLTSAVAASGVAFAVGELAKKLIEQLGWLDSATVEPRSFQSIWASH